MFFTRDKSFYKTLVTLAIPIALQNAVTFAVGLADNVMIGTLGDSAISGVYVGSQLQTLLQMFIGGIEGAILILAAQYWGKRGHRCAVCFAHRFGHYGDGVFIAVADRIPVHE